MSPGGLLLHRHGSLIAPSFFVTNNSCPERAVSVSSFRPRPLYSAANLPDWLAGITRYVGAAMRVAVLAAAMCLGAVGLSVAADAGAAMNNKMPTSIRAQPLGPALKELARERGFQVVFRSEVVGATRTHGAYGKMTTNEALTKLLEGTNLAYFRY